MTVDNLSINVTETLLGSIDHKTYSISENWGAPKTSFPETTPFSVTRGGTVVGGGTLYTHIYAQCPPTGTPSAYVTWSEATPLRG